MKATCRNPISRISRFTSQFPIKATLVVAVAALGLQFSTKSAAITILVDFGSSTSGQGNLTSSPDGFGNYWNNSSNTSFTVANLVDTNNNSTGFGLNFTTPVAVSTSVFAVTPDVSLGNLNVTTAAYDSVFSTDTVTGTTFKLSGLNPSMTYSLRLYGARDNASIRTTIFTVTGANNASGNLQTSGTGLGLGGVNYNNINTFDSGAITPDVNNEIFVNFKALNTGSNFAYLNAMEISVVPEPSSAMLAGVTLIGTLLLRRRRAAS